VYEYLKSRQAIEDLSVRRSDVAIVEKGHSLNVPTFILMSPQIYGIGTGLFNRQSIQVPSMVRGALKAKCAEVVADGSQRWGNVRVTGLANLYELLVGKILDGEPVPSGERGIYFTVSGEHQWKDIASGIASAGHALGILPSADIKSVSLEDAAAKWMGGNLVFTETVFASK
jgi:nucleoside-diphosphate-sugar epimerase